MANSDITFENAQAVPHDSHTEVPAPTGLEETVAKLWAEVLEVPQVGFDEHFISLGGQSLKAVLLLLRVQQTFGVEVPFKTFLEAPTVRELCVQIEKFRKNIGQTAADVADEMASEEGVL